MSPDPLSRIEQHGVVPNIMLDDVKHAASLAAALYEGGLPVAEISLRSESGQAVLSEVAAHPGLLIGAGHVVNAKQAEEAIAAGAKFIMCPGIDGSLVKLCQERNVPVIPGACTPTEVMLAANLGLRCVSFFPCDAMGGMPLLKALYAAFPEMKFVPNGGMSLEGMPEFLAFKPVMAVSGNWIVKKEWLADERFDIIVDACAATVAIVKQTKRGVDTSDRVLRRLGTSRSRDEKGLSRVDKAVVEIADAFSGE
jgi:2-dehydro-3-deoxyphosphogluconate aldolase/(4S)-4-hydroxy-2-oxoglutarate aldolase